MEQIKINAAFAKKFSALSFADQKKIVAAAARHIDLDNRSAHPAGNFDKAKRFYLENKCACCDNIRSPSRAWPFTYLNHARSVTHVCHEMGIDEHMCAVRSVVRLIKAGSDRRTVMHEISATAAKKVVDAVIKRAATVAARKSRKTSVAAIEA